MRRSPATLLFSLLVAAVVALLPAAVMADGWTQSPNGLNDPRADAVLTTGLCPGSSGTAAATECMYDIGGGHDGNNSSLADVEYFDPSQGTDAQWQVTTSLNQGLGAAAGTTAPCPGSDASLLCIYVIGGHSGPTDQNAIEVFDPVSSTWTTLSGQLNAARYWLSAAAAPCPGSSSPPTDPQCVYALGAFTNEGYQYLTSVEYYDPSTGPTGTWTTLTNGLVNARAGFASATGPCPESSSLPGEELCIYAFGGFSATDGTPSDFVGSAEYYDPASGIDGQWTLMPNGLAPPRELLGGSSGPCPGTSGLSTAPQCIYAIGGDASGSVVNGVQSYDPSSGSGGVWTSLTDSLNSARGEAPSTSAPCPGSGGLITDSQCIYTVSGWDGAWVPGYEYYSPASATPSLVGAKSVAAAARVGRRGPSQLHSSDTIHVGGRTLFKVRLRAHGKPIAGRRIRVVIASGGVHQRCKTRKTSKSGRASRQIAVTVPQGKAALTLSFVHPRKRAFTRFSRPIIIGG